MELLSFDAVILTFNKDLRVGPILQQAAPIDWNVKGNV